MGKRRDILTSIHGNRLGITATGQLILDGQVIGPWVNPTGAEDYFVDGNVGTSGDGLTWDNAFDTIAEAIAASNISIALTANRWWARRNRIFILGDGEFDEDLTVLPEKCDMIGMGYDITPYPRIQGNHAIAAATKGVRMINLGFFTDATGDLLSLPAGCHGFEMHGCLLHPGTTSTKAIEITSAAHVRIDGNKIMVGGGDRSRVFGLGISVEGLTSHDLEITNNYIDATLGIDVVESTGAHEGGLIANNFIRAAGLCIDDQSGDFQIHNNNMISAAADDGSGTGGGALAVICAVAMATGNRLSCAGDLNAPYPPQATLS